MSDEVLTVRGAAIPRLGFGTWLLTGREARDGVRDALDLGYRHVDTARAYENEDEVGDALRESPVDRDDVWVTTKLAHDALARDDVRAQLEGSLRALRTGYVDLLLIHWPNPDFDLRETLDAMAGLQAEGKVRHLGVSNFPPRLLEEALAIAPVIADQVEFHPMLGQPELLEIAEARDLTITAYSPFAHGRLLDDPVLTEIGEAHGKSAGQVALRWLLDQPRVTVIPKASSHANRAANLEVFDFELSAEERERIDALPKDRRTADPAWAPDWG